MSSEDQVPDLLQEAEELEEAGDFVAASSILEKALTIDPTDARVWLRLGHCLTKGEQYTAAIDALEHATGIDPSLSSAYSRLSQAFESVGRLAEAEQAMRRAVEIHSTSARFVLLGDIQASLGRDQAAEESFREALRLDPTNDEAMFNLAVLIRFGRDAEAEALLRQAIGVDPLYAEAYRELGFELARQRKFDLAEEELLTAVALDPDDEWVSVYLGTTLRAQNRWAEAKVHYNRARELAPLWRLPSLLLSALDASSATDEATEHRVLAEFEATVNDAELAITAAQHFASFGFAVDAKRWIRRALDIDPAHLGAQHAWKELGR
jgi:tetratricopeptide (TPR) repeat protein